MADIKTPQQRSINMSHIRGMNTKPEEYIRKLLYAKGYRYRKNYKGVEGKPDIWIPKYKTAIFVNGCFWHRHKDCKYAYLPKSRIEFWNEKFRNNIERDNAVQKILINSGVHIIIIWECTIKRMAKDSAMKGNVLEIIEDFIASDNQMLEI